MWPECASSAPASPKPLPSALRTSPVSSPSGKPIACSSLRVSARLCAISGAKRSPTTFECRAAALGGRVVCSIRSAVAAGFSPHTQTLHHVALSGLGEQRQLERARQAVHPPARPSLIESGERGADLLRFARKLPPDSREQDLVAPFLARDA